MTAKRVLMWIMSLTAAVGVTIAAFLAHPQPIFPYRAASGRLELHSDEPFSAEDGLSILRDIDTRLRTTSLDTQTGTHRVFIANASWLSRLTFLWNYGAGGVNYYPLTRNVFIRGSDIHLGLVSRPSGGFASPPRTLAYYAAHEIGHSLTGEKTGILAYGRLPVWIREGVADYIGFGGEVDVPALTRQMRDGDPDLDPSRSGLYARYRLLVAYLAQKQGWSIERILTEVPKQSDVEKAVGGTQAQFPRRLSG